MDGKQRAVLLAKYVRNGIGFASIGRKSAMPRMMSSASSQSPPVTPSWLRTLPIMSVHYDPRGLPIQNGSTGPPPTLYAWTFRNLRREVSSERTRRKKKNLRDGEEEDYPEWDGFAPGDPRIRPLSRYDDYGYEMKNHDVWDEDGEVPSGWTGWENGVYRVKLFEDNKTYHKRNNEIGTSTDGFHILGVGNLGKLFATSLAMIPRQEPIHITLVVRRQEQLEQWGPIPKLEIQRSDGQIDRADGFDIEWWSEEKPSQGPIKEVNKGRVISKLIIATKAQDALAQLDRVCNYLDRTSAVAFVQNGMNRLWPPYGKMYCEKREEAWGGWKGGHPNFISCVTTHGVTSLGPLKSLHASPADVAVGPVLLNDDEDVDGRYNRDILIDWLVKAPHLNAREVSRSDLWMLQLEKLVVNSVINPLTAILRCKNGELFKESTGTIALVKDRLVEEASSVLLALADEESTREIYAADEGENPNVVEERIRAHRERFALDKLKKMLDSVGEKVKENRSSMLQDVEAGRPTENREFNGWLVETATALGHRPGEKPLNMDAHKKIIELVEQGVQVNEEELGKLFS